MKTALFLILASISGLITYLYISATEAQICIKLIEARSACYGDASDHCMQIIKSYNKSRKSGEC